MRRVASPVLLTFRTWKFASFMNVVGSCAEAFTATVLTPVAASVVSEKKSAAVGRIGPDGPEIADGGKFALKIATASALGFPLLSARAAPSAAPSTALDNWAFTT